MPNFQRFTLSDFLGRHNIEDARFDAVCNLVELDAAGPWIVGGAVRRLITRTPQDSDFDLAFPSEEALEACSTKLEVDGFKRLRATEEHVELIGDIDDKPTTIQLLKVVYGENPEEVIDAFDFTICQLAYDGTDLICGAYTLWDLARESLVIHKVTYGAATVRRLVKYSNQGFTFCQGTAVALLEAIVANPAAIRGDVTYVD